MNTRTKMGPCWRSGWRAAAVLALWMGAATGSWAQVGSKATADVHTATFTVVEVSPAPETLDFPRHGAISVRFSGPVDPSSVDASTFMVMGRWTGNVPGSFVFSPDGTRVTFHRNAPFSSGEQCTVVLTRGLRSLAQRPLERSYTFQFWTRSQAASYQFSLVQVLVPNDRPYGAWGGDLNADQRLDLVIPNEISADVSVFMNQGSDQWIGPVNYGVGPECSANEGMDYDGDGKPDFICANGSIDNISVLIGNGDGTFQPQVNYDVGGAPYGLAALDLEGDGDADVVTSNRYSSDLSVLRNRGNAVFDPEVRIEGGVSGEKSVAAADFNRDGFLDLVVVGIDSSTMGTLLNDGTGQLQPFHQVGSGAQPWMVVAGDLDGDGSPDAFVANSGSARVSVHLGDGQGRLGSGIFRNADSFPISVDLGDLDGDGDLDGAASAFSSANYSVYRNDGTGKLTRVLTLNANQAGSCVVLNDRDGDGDLDLTGIDEIADVLHLFAQQ